MNFPGSPLVWFIIWLHVFLLILVVATRRGEIAVITRCWHQPPRWSRQWPTAPWGRWLRQLTRFTIFIGLGVWFVAWVATTAVHNAWHGWPSGPSGDPEFLACVMVIGCILIAVAWSGLVAEPTRKETR